MECCSDARPGGAGRRREHITLGGMFTAPLLITVDTFGHLGTSVNSEEVFVMEIYIVEKLMKGPTTRTNIVSKYESFKICFQVSSNY